MILWKVIIAEIHSYGRLLISAEVPSATDPYPDLQDP
jgi:hypothetical protein